MDILIIDDDKECCNAMDIFLRQLRGCRVSKAYNGSTGWQLCQSRDFDLIFSDVSMPGLSGIELAQRVNAGNRKTRVVLISGVSDIIQSINALETGVMDFITKPVDVRKLKAVVDTCREKPATPILEPESLEALPDDRQFPLTIFAGEEYTSLEEGAGIEGRFFLGASSLRATLHKLEKLWGFADIPILLEGKTGTGKEVVAKYIHYKNTGGDKPFVALNCATIPRELFASELFGYEKGAFTGAKPGGHPGFFKLAEKGTLFLDEITEIPLEMQSQLLRVLQEGEYYSIGGRKKQVIDLKIIFATNRDIGTLVSRGLFREDLYYRINVCRIELPPLAQRREDIIPLAILFIRQLNARGPGRITSVEAGFLRSLEQYDWPGNVRELKNRIIKAVLLCESGVLSRRDVTNLTPPSSSLTLNPVNFELPPAPFNLEEYVRRIVKKTLDKFDGNKTRTAHFLHLTRMQLYNKYKVL